MVFVFIYADCISDFGISAFMGYHSVFKNRDGISAEHLDSAGKAEFSELLNSLD